jgi:hypothetical protein
MDEKDCTPQRVSNGFKKALVYHRYASVVTARADATEFPADYYPFPVARVDSEDLSVVWRVTQQCEDLDESERTLVHWVFRGRSTSVGDVVVLDYGTHREFFRCDSFQWTRLVSW